MGFLRTDIGDIHNLVIVSDYLLRACEVVFDGVEEEVLIVCDGYERLRFLGIENI